MTGTALTLFLCGDVMTGRGIDQILPSPGSPHLWERHVHDARAYVALAERVGGPIPYPVDVGWPWGDALRTLDDVAPDVRLLNLETSVTGSDDVDTRKAVHYRMSPGNVGCLAAVRPDVCALANNHVLDFGTEGLAETLDVLAGAGLATAGAGRDAAAARRPVVHPVGGRRVVVFSFAMESSGVPPDWAAAGDRAGIDFADVSDATAADIADRIARVKRDGDVVVASVHWGSNWGYEVSPEQVGFAHRLVDSGVDVVHGHSSHHPRPLEVYRDRPILYGCGDFVTDYEGIGGHDEFRDDLRLLYFVTLRPENGLAGLRMAAMRTSRLRLCHAAAEDTEWLRDVLDSISRPFGSRVERTSGGMLALRCAGTG